MIYPTATGFGGGHYRTFDGRYLFFPGIGDFTTLEVLDRDVTVFTLQGRKHELGFCCHHSTYHQGLAFGQSNLAFQVSKLLSIDVLHVLLSLKLLYSIIQSVSIIFNFVTCIYTASSDQAYVTFIIM